MEEPKLQPVEPWADSGVSPRDDEVVSAIEGVQDFRNRPGRKLEIRNQRQDGLAPRVSARGLSCGRFAKGAIQSVHADPRTGCLQLT